MLEAEEIKLTFGERLKIIRSRKKMSQVELAKRVDLFPYTINNYEKDKYMPNGANLERICKVLDVTASELLGF